MEGPRVPRVYLMVGIPAAGKTTWIEHNLPASVMRIHLDQIRGKVYGHYPTHLDPAKEKRTWREAEEALAGALRGGRDVVVDSMALTRDWRRRLLAIARRASQPSPEFVAVFLDTPVDVSLVRNRGREKHVLDEVVREMATHLQPPVQEEGFESVIHVLVGSESSQPRPANVPPQ